MNKRALHIPPKKPVVLLLCLQLEYIALILQTVMITIVFFFEAECKTLVRANQNDFFVVIEQ